MTYGEKLKTIRRSLGLTQQEFADRLGVQKTTLSRYERGERSPSLSNALEISRILGFDLDAFLDEDLYVPTPERIHSERERQGYSVERLASLLHISADRLLAFERGEIYPTSIELSMLSKVFCTSTDWLLGLQWRVGSPEE